MKRNILCKSFSSLYDLVAAHCMTWLQGASLVVLFCCLLLFFFFYKDFILVHLDSQTNLINPKI